MSNIKGIRKISTNFFSETKKLFYKTEGSRRERSSLKCEGNIEKKLHLNKEAMQRKDKQNILLKSF